MWDNHGKPPLYYKYKSNLIEFYKDLAQVQAEKQTVEGAIEELRRRLVASMRTGEPLIIYLDHFMPDFYKEYTSDDTIFPAEKIFDFQEWRKDEVYKKIVREEENVDLIGNRPFFFQNNEFHITLLAKYVSDE